MTSEVSFLGPACDAPMLSDLCVTLSRAYSSAMKFGVPLSFLKSKLRGALSRAFKHSTVVQSGLFRSSWKSRNSLASFEGYFNDEGAPHRAMILKLVTDLAPSTVYEFGCYSGPTLRLLARHLATCRFYGTDINQYAIAYASEHLPSMTFARADDASLDFLARWLPPMVDVSIVSSVFYSMSTDQVARTLRFLIARSRFVLLGCNLSNYEGQGTKVVDAAMQHPYQRMFRELRVRVVSRSTSPKQDVSLTEFVILAANSPLPDDALGS